VLSEQADEPVNRMVGMTDDVDDGLGPRPGRRLLRGLAGRLRLGGPGCEGRHVDPAAQEFRQQRVTQGGEGAGFVVEVLHSTVEGCDDLLESFHKASRRRHAFERVEILLTNLTEDCAFRLKACENIGLCTHELV